MKDMERKDVVVVERKDVVVESDCEMVVVIVRFCKICYMYTFFVLFCFCNRFYGNVSQLRTFSFFSVLYFFDVWYSSDVFFFFRTLLF